MIKILHISKFYPPCKGGIEVACENIIRMTHEFEHKVICFNHIKLKKSIDFVNGIEVFRSNIIGNFSSQPIAPLFYFHLKQTINEFKPDIIHFHLPNPLAAFNFLLIKLEKNVKLVIHWHSDIVKQNVLYKLYRPFEQRILSKADVIIAGTKYHFNKSKPLSKYLNKCKVVPFIIEENKLELTEDDKIAIEEIKNKYGKNIIFFIGRHIKYKGLKYLIEAEKYIKSDFMIVIAGGGKLTESLKKIANSERVKFIGKINDDKKRQFYFASKIFAFPSITKNEAFGLALAEALYCGCPAITFTIEGSGVNFVNKKNITGLEVENSNSEKYGKAIDLLLSDDALRLKYSEQGKKWIRENFIEEVAKPKYIELYNELLEKIT